MTFYNSFLKLTGDAQTNPMSYTQAASIHDGTC